MTNLTRITLESDNVFGDDGAEHQLATVTGTVADGYLAALSVAVDTGTEPSGGGAPAGGGPAGGGEPPSGNRPSGAPSQR